MVSKLFIESKPVALGFEHLYLVLETAEGIEKVIRGGTERDIPIFFGQLEVVEVDKLLSESEDKRVDGNGNILTPAQRNQTLINLDGRDAQDVWNIAVQHARNINDRFNYNAFVLATNSNSTIASVLRAVGIDILDNLPGGKSPFTFPGIDNFLLNFSNTLVGKTSDDVIVGGYGDDRLEGGVGEDLLTGSRGNDTLIGGIGADTALYESSYIENNRFNYEIDRDTNGIDFIVDARPPRGDRPPFDGTDTLSEIEFLEFTDARLSLSEVARYSQQAALPTSPNNSTANGGFISLEVPRSMADGDAEYTITLSSLDGNNDIGYNFALIIDRSGSMGGQRLQDAKDAYIRLIDSLIESGVADNSTFAVIPFNSGALLNAPLTAEEAKSVINSIGANGDTNFGPPIARAIEFFSAVPSNSTNIAYFLSDGRGSGATDALQQYADVRAYGIGLLASREDLDIIDSNDADILENSSDLAQEFENSGFEDDGILSIEILVGDQTAGEGVVVPLEQFKGSAAGLTYKGVVENLNVSTDAQNEIRAEVSFSDGRPSVTVEAIIKSGAVSLSSSLTQGTNSDETLLLTANDKSINEKYNPKDSEKIDAKGGNDRVIGNAFDNFIDGGAGDDILRGESGDDILVAGAGSDRLDGGAGIDIAFYSGNKNDAGTISKIGDIITVGDTEQDTLLNIEYIEFQDLWVDTTDLTTSETIEIDGFTLAPREANHLTGSRSDDRSDGRAGNDSIILNCGNDILRGSAGNDTLNGGAGNDTLEGGDNNDTLNGGNGNDLIDGGAGNDTIRTGTGNDQVDGGDGTDTVIYDRKLNQVGPIRTAGDTILIGRDNIDTLNNIEFVQFSDITLTADELRTTLPFRGFDLDRWGTRQGAFGDSQQWQAGDFNGDGLDDFAKAFRDNGQANLDVHLSNDSSFDIDRWATRQGFFADTQQWLAGDFNGDGRDDLAKAFSDSGQANLDVHLSNGSRFDIARWATGQGFFADTQQWLAGDFNGDGLDDLAKAYSSNGQANIDVHLSDGSSFNIDRWATQQGGFSNAQKWLVGDFNGDGRDDLAKAFNNNGQANIDVHLSDGSGFNIDRWATQQGGFSSSQKWLVGDFNGDGRDDLAKSFATNNQATIDVHLSENSRFVLGRGANQQAGFWDAQQWLAGDFNGDGRDDLGKAFNSSGQANLDVHLII